MTKKRRTRTPDMIASIPALLGKSQKMAHGFDPTTGIHISGRKKRRK